MRIVFFMVLLGLALAGCNRTKVIPDEQLQDIFKDIYLANAYTSSHPMISDSVDIYEPILHRYGFSSKDFKYTIASFTKRKSSRLSDIIDQTIKELEGEYMVYERRVAILDTVELIARERCKDIVYTDSLINVTRMSDTSKLRIKIPVKEGTYKIEYVYTLDSADLNYNLKTSYVLRDSVWGNRTVNTQWLRQKERQRNTLDVETSGSSRELTVLIGNYTKKMSRPSLRIDSLSITYYLPKRVALDSLSASLVDYKLLIDGKEYAQATKDSLTLGVKPPRIVEKCDSIR